MRLQLTAALAICLAVPAAAQNQTSVHVDTYSDGWITVVSPGARASVGLHERVRVSGGYSVDLVSGATRTLRADLVSSATRFEEVRHQTDVTVDVDLGRRWRLALLVAGSFEKDYTTLAFGPGATVELLGRRAALSLRYTASTEQVGLATGEPLRERGWSHTLDLGWSHILGPRTTLSFLATAMLAQCGEIYGCQASPYRFVPLTDGAVMTAALRERHPSERYRGSVALRVAQALTPGLALHAGYRFYADSWSIQGHTVDLTVASTLLGDRLHLSAGGRFAWQGPAAFFRERYVGSGADGTVPGHRTADQELAGVIAGQVSLSVEWSFLAVGPFLRIALGAHAAHHWYRYDRFPGLDHRNAWVAGGGVRLEL